MGSYKDMKINRDKYLKPFNSKNFPNFLCPNCREGYLLLDNGSFKCESTDRSKRLYDLIDDVSAFELKFISFLKCNNKNCKELVSLSGIGNTKESWVIDSGDINAEPELEYDDFLEIKYMFPSVDIFEINRNCPKEISYIIKQSFCLFWNDPSSAGNKIRVALELLMDRESITDCDLDKKGNSYKISLDKRIKLFGEKQNYKKISKLLLSLKIVGNAGSHKNILNKSDILDAYDVLGYALDEIYLKKDETKRVKSIAEDLSEKHKEYTLIKREMQQ